jgi:uncharacterized protein YutE (UPF0331/DUF86 family)/predicted nucleotidyltransferase
VVIAMNLFEKQAQLNQLFTQNPVDAAYLSGSLAGRASFGHLNDVDIAILLHQQIEKDRFLDYQLYFLSELTRRLEADTIDVMILNQASLLLQLQVIKYGQILYSRDEKRRIAFETHAVMQYLDFKRMDEMQSHALEQRLRGSHTPLDGDAMGQLARRLREATAVLREMEGIPVEEFKADYHRYGLAERYMLIAIETCLQACGAMVAALGLRRPEAHHDLLSAVAAQHLMPRELAFRLELLVNQREALLREPEAVDVDALHGYLSTHLGDLDDLAAVLEQHASGNKDAS